MTVSVATTPALFSQSKSRADPKTGIPSDDASLYYQQRATEGGLLISEATWITPSNGGYPGSPGIHWQDHIRAWKTVTTAVHEKKGAPYEIPHALTVDEIKSITQDFAQAAKNAIQAGFDGIKIHAANGYLLDQFTNTSSNKRSDHYGGSIENRSRFALEVVDAVSKAIGDEQTAIRLSPYSGFQDMKDDTPVATWSYLVQQLETTHPDLAYLHFVEPRVRLFGDNRFTPEEDHDETLSLQAFRPLWSGPFVSAGNYTYSVKSAYDRADASPNNLVAVGRAFIANLDLVEGFRNHWELTPYNRDTFYTPGPEGYIDYPFYNATN
ncbi:unnamed protein product [Absidia cylindrospora]